MTQNVLITVKREDWLRTQTLLRGHGAAPNLTHAGSIWVEMVLSLDQTKVVLDSGIPTNNIYVPPPHTRNRGKTL